MSDSDFQVMYDYTDVPTLKRFALSNKRVRLAMGCFGCLRGDTLVATEQGLLPIADIDRPMRVLSWNAKTGQFQFSLSGGAFPKGKDYLYQVVTPRGEFVASGHHRVLVGGDRYLPVSDLQSGNTVFGCSASHLSKFVLGDQRWWCGDGLRYHQKLVDWMGRCAASARQYGLQLLREADISRLFVPQLGDARRSVLSDGWFAVERRGGQWGQLLQRTHLDQSAAPRRTGDFYHGDGLPGGVAEVCGEEQPSARNQRSIPSMLQSLLQKYSRRIAKLWPWYLRSSSSSLSECSILSVTKLAVKDIYWDMQVLDTNNYVTADGAIHHNSGKSSACVMEIIRRAHEQAPGPDGIRRSRWVVVRNSYNQLKDTTIKTFHDWFPPKMFGEYRVTDHSYIITKFPGVHLEVLFRALDRPDQVSNLLSLEVTGAWFNEAREIAKTIIEAMDARIGRYPSKRDGGPSWYGIIMDTNPPDEDSYLYKMFEKIQPDNWEIFKQPSGLSVHAENTKHLPKNYYVNLAKGKDEMYKRIYIHGQYGYLISGKPVFMSFKDNVHVALKPLEPMKGVDVLIGFDFGLQPACTIGQLTPLGQLRILDELVSDGMGLRQFCENQLLPLLRMKYFGMNVMGFGDPSGTSRTPTDETTCFDILHSAEVGLSNVIPATTNAIMPRVQAVENFLNKMNFGEPGFVISPNCHFIRKAMNGAYHYDRDSKGNGEEYKAMPVKNFASHVADSLQMLCLYISEKEAYDKQRKSFMAQMKPKVYRPASAMAGY